MKQRANIKFCVKSGKTFIRNINNVMGGSYEDKALSRTIL